MRKVLCVVAVMGLTVAWAAPAQAARHSVNPTKHSVNSTIKFADVARTGSFPVTGTEDYAGTIKGALGAGAIVGHNVFGPVPAFHGTLRVFLNKGTLKVTLEGTGAPSPPRYPAGTFDFSGSGEITKGSGMYEGAHGNVTFSGRGPIGALHTATIAVKGSVKY